MRRVVITGASGFIGSALARKLTELGVETHVVVRPGSVVDLPSSVRVHRLDDCLEPLQFLLTTLRPEVVFHLASLVLVEHQPKQAEALVASNILFGTRLLEAMLQAGCQRLVNTGTSWQHFGGPGYRPVNLYAATKQAFEDILLYYHDACSLSSITLRLFDTYGPRDHRRKLANILLEAAWSGEVLEMTPGEQVIDISHIDDVVAAFVLAGERLCDAETEPILEDYLVSGERYTLRELVALASAAFGRDIQAVFGGRPYREREVMVPVCADGRLLPGWTPSVGLIDGLSRLAATHERGKLVTKSGLQNTKVHHD